MKKLLVTGASGFLGWNLCQTASQQWEVSGTYFSQKVNLPKVNLFKSDLRKYQEIAEVFKTIKPDAVIHTAAAAKPNFCQTYPEESYAINVTASINIARLCNEYKIPCAFTSTDLVFDGKNPFYKESDPVSPICYYGEQKVTAETKMSEITEDLALCRMPLMFGRASPVSPSFIQGMISNLKEGKAINLFTDEFRTPASATTASAGLLLAIEQEIKGILHLGGKERISRYQFGLLLADILSLPKELIKPGKQADVKMVAKRSPDTSLDNSKAFALGYQPLSLKQELKAIQ
ncbi:NAD(P)-dependent oxidoreductase [Waterburya agarophytonicola K14]|uniref:NAD(P)-dependent oxidoreductase n=1 Tax=Waterburya agarophytonicola KI4 TaxID=2874699 RepID=A0A964FF72_9CYAN|nr:NAD(P)-dependent oxidoreductase [Waterburya agarophytonicola]MCC0176667.1 NAD(P)-dependent oxidoreductase [Waterburya agarophytonicola KI4]